MRRHTAFLAAALLAAGALAPSTLAAQSAADSAAIRAVADDYMLGWYEGDGARMQRALHPALVKRIVVRDSAQRARLQEMSAEQLVRATASGAGTRTPAGSRRAEVRILDVFGDVALVRADMQAWADYFQMARWDGEWRIVNVLWAMRPGAAGARR